MAIAQCAFAEYGSSAAPSSQQDELSATADLPPTMVSVTLPSAELWLKTARKNVRLSYSLGLIHTNNVTCDLYAPNGSVIRTSTLTANGTYSFSFSVRLPAQGRYDYNISCYPSIYGTFNGVFMAIFSK